MPITWKIVGGEDKGGVLVREGQELSSPKTPDRLSTGARVEQLALVGERLHYKRLTGTGPLTGWITIALEHKLIAERETMQLELPPLPQPPSETTPPPVQVPQPAPSQRSPPQNQPPNPKPNPQPNSQPNPQPNPQPRTQPNPEFSNHVQAEEVPTVEQTPSKAATEAEPKISQTEQPGTSEAGPLFDKDNRASKFPKTSATDIKWMIFNEIWHKVSVCLLDQNIVAKRDERQRDAKKNEEHAWHHLKLAEETGAFSRITLLHIKQQAGRGGVGAGEGIKQGNWLLAARHQALDAPVDMEEHMWKAVVRAIKIASVAAHKLAREEPSSARFFAEFDEAWREICE